MAAANASRQRLGCGRARHHAITTLRPYPITGAGLVAYPDTGAGLMAYPDTPALLMARTR
jgi:hypothetical protein